MPWMLVPLGVGAGALTTVTGMGGGVLLVLCLSVWLSPHEALAIATPALLVSNVHRSVMFWRHVDRKRTTSFAGAAFAGALVGGFVTVALPEAVLAWMLLAVAALAVARALGWIAWTPGPRALGPAGFVSGAFASAGGAGVVMSPVLLAAGLRAEAFVATSSISAVAIHTASLIGFGTGGLVSRATLFGSAVLAIGLLAGNFVGRDLRTRVGDRGTVVLTYVVLAVVVALAVAGVA